MAQAEDSMPNRTTYTTEPDNLWVYTLGARSDCWVRQLDRMRHPFALETDTAALEAWDVGPNAVTGLARLKAAMGLKGEVMLSSSGAMYLLFEDCEPVHLFAPDDGFTKVPLTVVPELLDASEGKLHPEPEQAILAALEAGPPPPVEFVDKAAEALGLSLAPDAPTEGLPPLVRAKRAAEEAIAHLATQVLKSGTVSRTATLAAACRDLAAARGTLDGCS